MTTPTPEPKLKRIILSTDTDGYAREIFAIERTATDLNTVIQELCAEQEITFTDSEIQTYFIDRANPEPYISELFQDERPAVRKILQNELRSEIRLIQNNNYLFDEVNQFRDYLTVTGGEVVTDKKGLKKLKTKFEYSLDTDRAKMAYDLHKQGFEAIRQLIKMAAENQIFLRPTDFFDSFNSDGEPKMQNINYNKI